MKRAVFFVYVWPEARSSAAGLRTHDLIRWLLADGWAITALSPSKASAYSAELEVMGVAVATVDANDSSSEPFLRSLQADLVLFDRFVTEEQFGWRVRSLWPQAITLIDTQDLHSVRRAREALKEKSWEEICDLPHFAYTEDFLRELSSLHRAHGSFVVSAWEEKFLRERFQFPGANLLHLPLAGRVCAAPSAHGDRRGFAFLGNFRHAPNLDGIQWFIEKIWPSWRNVDASAELHLYGAYPPASISSLSGKNGISAHGPIEDHRAALSRHLALVAPLRFGAGIKGKVLEAWGTGTPVLGTPIAFEGMGHVEGATGLTFRDAESFVLAAQDLGIEKWNKLSQGGRDLLEQSFAEADLRQKFLHFVSEKNISPTRDLVGAMLNQAQNNATKYFSRWIEAKNKKAGT